MKFAYEDLSPEQFEELIVILCQRLLGISVQGFTKGPDGGKDARFVGTAELHPSKSNPWSGTTVIQAKHTNGINRYFNEPDFYKPDRAENTVVGKEVERILRLKESEKVDHYMLFANRRLTGQAESEIRSFIAEKCGFPVESVYLCGTEQLELFLRYFPDVPELANIDPVESPLTVSPEDLAEVVEALGRHQQDIKSEVKMHPTERTSFEKKNKLNGMSAEYAAEQRRRYLKDAMQIQHFLAAPANSDLQQLYELVVEEFQNAIISKRKDYQSFDEVVEYLVDLLFKRDPILRKRGHKRLTRAVLFYMYWNCDIGQSRDVEAN